ncbi:MAG: DUF2254 domain-containing protein [Ruminococcaceae bacterium]|nr:DUF2254 domain-containing protein [Oscillospiraceae bacterium]
MDNKLIDFFNEYCKSQLLLRGITKSVCLSEDTNQFDEKMYYCDFQGDGYFCRIYLTDDGSISHLLSWDEADFEHDISEVFLLFNIDDFKNYSYDHCIVESRIKSAVDETVGMLFTYAHDIKRAGEGENYNKLLTGLNDSPSNKGPSLRRVLKNGRLHDKMVKTRSDKDRLKYIADLELWVQKGWLSEYGKRELKRLKQGYIDEEYDEYEEWEKRLSKLFFVSLLICFVASFVIAYGVLFLSDALFLGDGVLVFGDGALTLTALAGVVLWITSTLFFADKITVALAPQELKKYGDEYKKRSTEFLYKTKFERKVSKPLLAAFAALAVPFFMLLATANYSFGDNYFKSHFLFGNTTVSYSDCDIYLVRGEYNDKGDYEEYQYPVYCVKYSIDGEELSDSTGKIKNPQKQQQLKAIFDNNHISIKTIKNIDE